MMLAKELLPALDNLDRALEAAAKDDPLLDGVRLVRAELSAALARSGIDPVGGHIYRATRDWTRFAPSRVSPRSSPVGTRAAASIRERDPTVP